MPREAYTVKRFRADTLKVILQANRIIDEYIAQGFILTLRQLYYQFVARGLLENTFRNYKRIGSIVNDGRLAGLIDWGAIEDRTRSVESLAHWRDPEHILSDDASQFRIDKWSDQELRPEVWIEKEALAGVFERICQELDVSFLCCRGYTSQSIAWQSAQRHLDNCREYGQEPVILHFGDHDPSGIDMTRDNRDRLEMFMRSPIEVRRLALNMDQVEEYNPPPNYAKPTDSRFQAYMNEYGEDSWELDALEPKVLAQLVEDAVKEIRDEGLWGAKVEEEEEHRDFLQAASDNWEKVAAFLQEIR